VRKESCDGQSPRIGLLALTLELYEELAPGLREGREQWVREQILPALTPLAEVDFAGACYRREDVEDAIGQFEQDGLDGVLVMLLTYSPSQIALPSLRRTSLPILVWNTQELRAVTEAFASRQMTENHGVHGTQDLANVLVRGGVDFEYVTSHLSDSDPLAELQDFFQAAAAVHQLEQTTVGILGYPFPGMGDFAVDTTHMAATLGCDWKQLPMSAYLQESRKAAPDRVENLVQTYRNEYEVAETISQEDLAAAARAEVGLRILARRHSLGAVTYQFQAFGDEPEAETVPFIGVSRAMSDGIGFGGEGDIVGAAGTTFLNVLRPPAGFSEIFTIDFDGNALLMSHMGEANPALQRSDRKPSMAVRSPITETKAGQLVLKVSPEPGPATLFSLATGPDQTWRFVTSHVEILDFEPIDGLDVPHFKLRPDGDVREFLTSYAKAGGPHHNAICPGDARRRIKMAARILGAEYVEVH
jgi:L-arabinose isomerase